VSQSLKGRRPVVCYTDVGGTFTDCFVVDESGEFVIGKAPSTPSDIAEGFLNALDEAQTSLGMTKSEFLGSLDVVGYGATTVLNSVITRQGGNPGLLITRGFEDLLLMERGKQSWIGLDRIDRIHPVTHRHLKPLIPRSRVWGVSERIDSVGNVVIPLREEDVRHGAEELLANAEVDSIVSVFLWSFLADQHELRAKEIVEKLVRDRGSDVEVFCSSEVSPTLRELPRANATTIEAYAGPSTLKALARLDGDLSEAGFDGNLQVMQSAGGLAPAAHVRAIDTAMSGPVGGLVGARYVGELYGATNLISTDVGGTSFDVGLITDGFVGVDREPVLAGLLLALPMMEVDSIGAGGGTIARIDSLTGRLQVGPESAGAAPGPVCYGKGGTEPTVTDADVALGYLSGHFIGGRIEGDAEASRDAIRKNIADPLGLSVEAAADGIRQVIDARMREAVVGLVSVRGFALEDYLLLGFGGAGPTHLCGYTDGLSLKGVLTFPYASVFSAFGAASADYEHHYHRAVNVVVPPGATDDELAAAGARLSSGWERLEQQALEQMRMEGIDQGEITLRHLAMVRYGKQLNDMIVTSPVSRASSAAKLREVLDAFEELYAHVYAKGAQFPQAGYEVFEVGLVASAPKIKPMLVAHPFQAPDPSGALIRKAPAWFNDGGVDTPRFDWTLLQPGNVVNGPGVVEHPTTTLVVPPGRSARLDEYRTVWIEG
jgi:acetone carboxylase beta subunit